MGIANSPVGANGSARSDVAEFFEPLRSMDREEIDQTILNCANGLCIDSLQSDVPLSAIEENSEKVNSHLRRIRFGIRILNEQNLTTVIEESMVQEHENIARRTTRFIPLIGSFNRLQSVACEVSTQPNENSVRKFLYASIAFGLEVSLWQSTVPYQMAWRGVRFTSTRTFLRYADKGCNGCIAFVMSELHWAIRAVPYEISSDNNVEFVFTELQQLHAEAKNHESIDWSFNKSKSDIHNLIGNTSIDGIGGGGVAPITAHPSEGGPSNGFIAIIVCILLYIWVKN
ncbi:hypothetical protein [Halovivax cerinus]|uniref:Uncharacterized protein n=1 Tax=Halovivax cerinus TaxID=1487865 RepID=A0ABD5NMK1_9EURY|nr:hypothetical protein [Halovivax cerinus]